MVKKTKKKNKKVVKKKVVKKIKTVSKPVRVHFGPPEKPSEIPAKPKITPYPEAGAKVQEFEDTLDSQLAGDTRPPKRPVGRPPNPPEPESPELTIDIVAGVIKIPFELWAISQNIKSLALTDEEAKQIAEPARQLLEYYLPKIPVIAYAWLSVSVSTFWVMRPRLFTIKEMREHLKRIQQDSRPAAPAQPGVVTKFPTEIKPERI